MVVIVKKLFQQMLILHPTLEHTLGRNHISALNEAKLSHIVAHLFSIQEHKQGKGLLIVPIVIKILFRIVFYQIILEHTEERNHLHAANVANLILRKVNLKSK